VDLFEAARGFIPVRRRVRIGVTGLRRAGKTSLLTSLAVNLLATGRGVNALPALTTHLAGRKLKVALTPSGAESLPRFDAIGKSAALAADPPGWPKPTDAVSLLSLDLDIEQQGAFSALPAQKLRLEFLDYPGEWLLDLPLLNQDFPAWSQAILRRLDRHPEAREFLGYVRGLPEGVAAEESLIRGGHDLYVATLRALQANGLSLLQPGRFLMPAPGEAPPWQHFFPVTGSGKLANLMQARFDAYQKAVSDALAAPGFANIDRLVVAADLLSALHAGKPAFDDAAAALALVASALSQRKPLPLLPSWLQPWGIGRIAFCATKSDHVASRQRANLQALMEKLTEAPSHAAWRGFALAAINCTEDFVWTLDGRPVSAVRGHVNGQGVVRSYPGEVPDRTPELADWAHPFLSLPDFTPKRLESGGRGAIPQLELDRLLVFLLEDML
jgi:predicted YcjX-like family ATPase